MEAGDITTLTAASDLGSQTQVSWEVDGVVGGNSRVGIISSSGSFTAPDTPQTVTISCSAVASPFLTATHTIVITPQSPKIVAASALQGGDGTLIINLLGKGFTAKSTVVLNGTSSPTVWLSNTQLQSTLSQANISGISLSALVSNPSPNPGISNTVEISLPASGNPIAPLPPGSPEDLLGCENPNTGTSTSDWGPANADYIEVTLLSPELIGSPTYASNSIFWISRETGPGQSVLLSGAFTPSPKTVKLALIPPGTADWKALIQQSTIVVPATQRRVTGLSFTIPASFPPGVYGFEIDDQSAPPLLALANVPSLSWSIGVPSTHAPTSALQHTVHDCGVEPGETLRMFGKNFSPSSGVVLQSSSGEIFSLGHVAADADSISALIPDSMQPGTYYAWVGSKQWDAASSAPVLLTILSPPAFTASTFKCSSLVGDGQTDNTALLQNCLDQFAPASDSGQISYITIPAGDFVLTGGVSLHPYEVLIGISPQATQFSGRPPAAPPVAWFTVPKHVGLANFALKAPVNPSLLVSSDLSGDPSLSGSLFADDIDFEALDDFTNGNEQNFNIYGPDVQVYDSTFRTTSLSTTIPFAGATRQNFGQAFGDGSIISGNVFINTNSTQAFRDSQNLIFENNTAYSEQGAGPLGGMGVWIPRQFAGWQNTRVSRNFYVGYNNFHDMGVAEEPIVTTDESDGAYLGYVAESTADTVTLTDDPSWIWTGRSNPTLITITIISGTGVGQHAQLESINGRTLTLMTPWKISPDSTSMVSITQPHRSLAVSHNTFTNTLGPAVNFWGTLDSSIEDNVLTNAGNGLEIWAFGPYGGPESFETTLNTDVLRNTINTGRGDLVVKWSWTSSGGIGIFDMPGCFLSGLLVRNNVVPSSQTIYWAVDLTGLSANLIEENAANLIVSSPRFLVQNNQPPPGP